MFSSRHKSRVELTFNGGASDCGWEGENDSVDRESKGGALCETRMLRAEHTGSRQGTTMSDGTGRVTRSSEPGGSEREIGEKSWRDAV